MKCRWIALAFGLCITLLAGVSLAQYPNRPIKLVIPFPPGGPTDIVGRLTAQKLTEGLGQPVIVENRPGASGTLGAEIVAKAPADGYTLLLGARAKPGQLAFGSGGNGHPLHIAGEMFKAAAGVDLLHVPYKGTAPVLTDLLAGRTQVIFEQSAALLPHIRTGKLKALAVAGPTRLSQLPDVPTSAEAGLPDYDVSAWFALLAPAGTPREVIARLNRETRRGLASRELQEALASQGIDPVSSSPEELAALIVADGARWARAVKLSGARLD